MNYGRAIRMIRSARGWTQSELARRSAFDASYVSLLESGRRTCQRDVANRIADALEVPHSLVDLLAADEDRLVGLDREGAASLGRALVRVLLKAERNEDVVSDG